MGARKLYEEEIMQLVHEAPEESLPAILAHLKKESVELSLNVKLEGVLEEKQSQQPYNEDDKISIAKTKLDAVLAKARSTFKNYDGSSEAFAKRKAEEKLLDF